MTDAEGNFWLEDRIMKIQSVVEQYGEDPFYISFSGGKDSTVLHYLVDEALPGNRIPRVYCNTGIEYVEMVRFVKQLREQDDRIEIITPGVNIQKMLRDHGYPFKSKDHAQKVMRFQNNGNVFTPGIKAYLEATGTHGKIFSCPKTLQCQFTPEYPLKVSDKCCEYLKEIPLREYAKRNNKEWTITGLMREEGGRRSNTKCITTWRGVGGTMKFNPLAVMTAEWEEWYIRERNVQLCTLYYPPYSFERTGCKGCPFNLHLQRDLDMLAEHFSAERRQCELIWKPVYDEYRRLGYRLRKDDGQTSLFEYD